MCIRDSNIFDVGKSPVMQYASKVLKVSSFWGSPPYTGYHPLGILGPPDCRTKSECASDAPWRLNLEIDPPVGARLLYPMGGGVLAYVKKVNEETVEIDCTETRATLPGSGGAPGCTLGEKVTSTTVDIEYHTMYKPDATGELAPCHIPVSYTHLTLPTICSV